MNLKDIRINERIRAREVRVIVAANNQQLGVMRLDDAIRRARSMGLDLVEIAPNAQPPVCRIVDFGKFRYDLSKQEKDKKQTTTKVKEVKFRVNIDEHDYITKVRHAEDFLDKGNKVKVHLQFRGREMAHQELGMQVVQRVRVDLAGMAHVDMEPKLVGRAIGMTLSPLPAGKRHRKFSKHGEELEPEPEDEGDGE
ncbi:MAG: translation initiation factor IF-3 [Verrucomicrobiaceae bacterium]|nr:MAG: translation initiation factor IF-3 [Verrucomicrobiaceae bacterium]